MFHSNGFLSKLQRKILLHRSFTIQLRFPHPVEHIAKRKSSKWNRLVNPKEVRKTLKQSGQQTTESSDRLCYYCKFFLATCASQLVVNNFLGRKMHIAEYNKRKKKQHFWLFKINKFGSKQSTKASSRWFKNEKSNLHTTNWTIQVWYFSTVLAPVYHMLIYAFK